MKLSDQEKHTLVHALTGSSGERKAYRNYYAAGKGHHSMPQLESLTALGLMVKGAPFGDDGNYYHCTAAGADIVGLTLPRD